MRMYSQFEHLDPLKGQLPWAPFHEASNVLGRARSILRIANRTSDEIQAIATDAAYLIERYFEYEKEKKLEEIKEDQKYGLLDIDEDGNFIGFKDEAYDDYDIHTSDNTPDLDALSEALAWGFDPVALEDVKDVKDYEYYAVYAICFLADYARTLEYKLQLNPIGWAKRVNRTYEPSEVAQLANKLFEAIEAVCFAERLRAVDRVEEKYHAKIEKLQAGAAVRITSEDYERMRDEIKRDLQAEDHAQRRDRSEANNNIRHQENRSIKQSVLDDFAQNSRRFDSAEKAADHYVDQLESRGIERSHRTVADWIRAYARSNGIRFR